jgi:hypothetical protein
MEKHAAVAPNVQIISQSAEDVQNIENAPAVSKGRRSRTQRNFATTRFPAVVGVLPLSVSKSCYEID